jgi:hypothetical protein
MSRRLLRPERGIIPLQGRSFWESSPASRTRRVIAMRIRIHGRQVYRTLPDVFPASTTPRGAWITAVPDGAPAQSPGTDIRRMRQDTRARSGRDDGRDSRAAKQVGECACDIAVADECELHSLTGLKPPANSR